MQETDIPDLQETEILSDASIDTPTENTKPKLTKKKILLLAGTIVIVVATIITIICIARGSVFDRIVTDMLSLYPFADNAQASDGSYLKIDTNPYDKDIEDMTYVQAYMFYDIQSDSLDGIKFVNKKLGFTDAVYSKMLETTALMGRQTDENSKYRVSWTYHPDKGLEVMYEKR